MVENILRTPVQDVRRKVQEGSAFLVCAYDSDEKFKKVHLQGAISLRELEALSPTLSRDSEIVFYCA